MQELFDKKLKNKIRNTFDNYYEPVNPAAWEQMKIKLLDRKKRRIIWINNITKAASIIIIIGISILLPKKLNHDNHLFRIAKTEQKIINTKKNNTKIKSDISKKNYVEKNGKINFSNKKNIKKTIRKNNKINISKTLISDNKLAFIENKISDENLEKDTAKKIIIAKKIKPEKQKNKKILQPVTDDFYTKNKETKKIKIAVSLLSHYNYVDASVPNKMNFGGGFLTEFELNKTFSINSGVLFSKHEISYNSYVENNANQDMKYENVIEDSGNSTEINLISFDIPINLQINLKKIFISVGVSSLVYVKEEYQDKFSISDNKNVFNSGTSEWENVEIIKNINEHEKINAFQTFDFAKLINFSFGYKIPIRNGNFVVEPYLKYPIGKLTNRDVAFGSGGVSLIYFF